MKVNGNVEEGILKLHRHFKIFKIVKENGPIGIIKIARLSGYRIHEVRYSLKMLQNLKIIKATTKGAAVTKDWCRLFKKMHDDLSALTKDYKSPKK